MKPGRPQTCETFLGKKQSVGYNSPRELPVIKLTAYIFEVVTYKRLPPR